MEIKDWTDNPFGPKVAAITPERRYDAQGWALSAGEGGTQMVLDISLKDAGIGRIKLGNADPYAVLEGYTRSNVADGVTAVAAGAKAGYKSGGVVGGILGALGIGGSGGGLFGKDGGGLIAGLGGLAQGAVAMSNFRKTRKDAQVIGGASPLGFNKFTDKKPEEYLSGAAQKEQGVGNYYNPTTRPYQMQQASSPNQGMLSQQNQSMVQPGGMGLLGSGNQRRVS